MKILFTPPYNTSLLFETDDMALFQQISKATLYDVAFIPDSTEIKKNTQEDEIAKLKKELEEQKAFWMDQYNEKTEVQDKLKEANAKLELALSKPKQTTDQL